MAPAVFTAVAAAVLAITAAPAAASVIPQIQTVQELELGADEQTVTLGFDPADLQPGPQSRGRLRREVDANFQTIIFHSPVEGTIALAGVPGNGLNITWAPLTQLQYTHLDLYLLNPSTVSGSKFANNVPVSRGYYNFEPPR